MASLSFSFGLGSSPFTSTTSGGGKTIQNSGVTVSDTNVIATASGDITIQSSAASSDVNLTAGSGGDVNIPANVGMTFGDDGEKIEGDGTDLTISSSNLMNLTATTDVVVPVNVGMIFGDGAEKIESNNTDLTINSGADINLTATSDVNLPANIGMTFGDDGEKIEGDGTDLTISSGDDIVLSPTDKVGIGNTNPSYKLDVSGDIRATGDVIASDLGEFDNRSFTWEELQKLLFQSEVPTAITKATMGGVDVDDRTTSMAVYSSELYLGTNNTTAATDSTAAKVLNYDGSTWSAITKDNMGVGVAADTNMRSMGVYDSELYIGTANTTSATDNTAAKVLVYDGSSWSVITKATMGGVNADTVMCNMGVYDSKLYIGTQNTTSATDSTAAKVLVYDGTSWSAITKATMGGVNADTAMLSIAVYNNKLYIGTANTTSATDSTAAKVLVYDGSSWSAITKATMGGSNADVQMVCMAVYNGKLYIGTNNGTSGTDSTTAKVLVYDGSNWSIITKATMGGSNADTYMRSMAVYNGKLYIGTQNTTAATDSTGAKVLVYDGAGWEAITKAEMGGAVNDDTAMLSMAVYGGRLYIGTVNTTEATDATAAKVCRFKHAVCETENDYCPRGF